MPNNPQKILFICNREISYTRNEYILKKLRKKYSIDVIASPAPSYFIRLISVFWNFTWHKNKRNYNYIFIGFLAQPLIPLVRLFYKGIIMADFFISLYDTICFDRQIIKPQSLLGKFIYKYEKWTLSLVDQIITDTQANKLFFSETFDIPLDKIIVLYAFANSDIFFPRKKENTDKDLEVFSYSTGQPLHGLDIIIAAAEKLKEQNIHFTIIGPLPQNSQRPTNITNIKWVSYSDLPNFITKADLCLAGPFGATAKADRVITGKTFQFALMAKAVILGKNQATPELFTDQENCMMVECANPTDLAAAVMTLKNNPQLKDKIAINIERLITPLTQKEIEL